MIVIAHRLSTITKQTRSLSWIKEMSLRKEPMRSFLKQAIYTRNCGKPICRAKIPQRRWRDDKVVSKTSVVLGLTEKRLIRSFLAYLVSSFFEMIPIMAILTVLTGILKQLSGDVMPESTIWISLGIMIVSIVGRIVFVNLSANARTLGSFAFGSEKRMEIGERLKGRLWAISMKTGSGISLRR